MSSTKGNRLFGGSSLGLSFRKGTAGAFAPELAKKLSQLIKMEKSLMRSIELVTDNAGIMLIPGQS
jgi:hypothetical protein